MVDAVAQVFAPDLLALPAHGRSETGRVADPMGAD